MKLQTKINLFFIMILSLLTLSMVVVGWIIINDIIYDLNKRLLNQELDMKFSEIKDVHQILMRWGIRDEEYVIRRQQTLLNQFQDYEFGETGNLFVISHSGDVLSHSDPQFDESLDGRYIQIMLKQQSGFVEYAYQNRERFCAFRTFEDWDWLLGVSVAKSEMFRKRSIYLIDAFLIIVLILILSAILLRIFVKKLVRRLHQTLACANEVEQGNLSARIESIDSRDEIGELQRNINAMIATIEHRTIDLRDALNALEETNQKYGMLVEQSLQGIAILQGNPIKFVFVNPKMIEIFGYTEAEFLAMNSQQIFNLIHSEDRDFVRNALHDRLKGNSAPKYYEARILRKDGEMRWVEILADRFSGMETPMIQAVYFDITKRKIAEEERQNAEERVRAVIETAEDMIYFQGLDGSLSMLNEANAKITGVSLEEFQKRPQIWQELVHPEDQKIAEEFFARYPDGVPYFEVNYRIKGKNGEWRWIYSRMIAARDSSGKIIGYNCIDRDITELKELEMALEKERESLAQKVEERTAELQKANVELARAARMKDEFLANMSHEFRTPLNAILGFSEALREQIYGELNPKQEKVLNIIEESGQHLLELINDILDLSKIITGKFELYISSVAVEELCDKSVQLVNQMAKRKNIHVSLRLDEHVKYIRADERRLKQILLNLLSNAVKYTEPDGEVGLEVKGDTENQWVHFVVWDTGIGIEEGDLGKIFMPFTQLDSKLSRKYSGTGLGLALVKKLVEMHGGKIDVESEIRKGTRFVISMPWEKSVNVVSKIDFQASSKKELVPPTEKDIQILIAEDNEINIMALSDYLTRKNYNVILAKNGVEAVEKTKAHMPDIVLMDVQMPEMDGLEAIRHIRSSEDETVNSVPIISLTGMAMAGDNEKCLAAGADHYISKPFKMSDLIDLINGLLGASD